jgi:hypothetical protein
VKVDNNYDFASFLSFALAEERKGGTIERVLAKSVIEPERLAYRAVTVNTKPLAFTVTYNLSEVTYNSSLDYATVEHAVAWHCQYMFPTMGISIVVSFVSVDLLSL